eukprot:CAMPEP_0118632184 /NCGR_PEP_ID=MMETSP0785-20121206/304_1 /TAXON_ID=91992 /ORGANISM="Bolidomonas pacifica, Strain CCMP 1866" /LENGTH=228 /DNA_ID=CAMNT_0006522927 /DNA_START=104 /DNA_END=787 /DNA_ORIENTATION=+
MRPVQECQLSGSGYRKNNEALDPARALWESEDLEEVKRLVTLYPLLAHKATAGKVTYGPQTGRPKHEIKNATDVHKHYSALMDYFTVNDEVRMDLQQLKIVRDWKMVRNRVRQNWLLLNSNDDETVRDVTAASFRLADEGDWKAALKTIDDGLFGVGPATASMILSLRYPTIAPYSEEAFRVAGIPSSKYTLKEYEIFHELMNNKADNIGCTPRDLEQAIYAAVYESY